MRSVADIAAALDFGAVAALTLFCATLWLVALRRVLRDLRREAAPTRAGPRSTGPLRLLRLAG